jgi:hypothetical protein
MIFPSQLVVIDDDSEDCGSSGFLVWLPLLLLMYEREYQ